jgi:hypothetical protein
MDGDAGGEHLRDGLKRVSESLLRWLELMILLPRNPDPVSLRKLLRAKDSAMKGVLRAVNARSGRVERPVKGWIPTSRESGSARPLDYGGAPRRLHRRKGPVGQRWGHVQGVGR